jgi:hypothetical protein
MPGVPLLKKHNQHVKSYITMVLYIIVEGVGTKLVNGGHDFAPLFSSLGVRQFYSLIGKGGVGGGCRRRR